MAVTGTEWTVRDASGKALCHSAGQSKRAADSRRKRAVRDGFALMCRTAGVVNSEGMYQDVHTGAYLPLADENTNPRDLVVIDRGHVVSDENNGAFCPCNLVPELRGINKAHGKRGLDSRLFKGIDPRYVWAQVWADNYARPSQLAAAGMSRSVHACCGVAIGDYCQC